MSIVGTIVAESLRLNATVELGLTLRRLTRIQATPGPDQPPVWTLIDFTCDDRDADTLADQLSGALATGPWYVDFHIGRIKYVVFSGRVFRFARDDAEGRAKAVEYGLGVGVPAAQLDWAS